MSVRLFLLLAIPFSIGFVGCSGQASNTPATNKNAAATKEHDHDHDHDGEKKDEGDFASSLDKAKDLVSQIMKAIDANDIEAAHDPLHEIGHVLESLGEKVGQQGWPAEKATAAKAAVDGMFESFMTIDNTLHDTSKTFDIEKLRPIIESGLKTLTESAGK